MTKLIKAEFYRVTHSGIFLKVFIVFGLLPLANPFLAMADMEVINLFYITFAYAEMGGLILLGYTGVVMAALTSNIYANRTYYYEIMNGANTHHIILSKLIVQNTLATIIMIVPTIIVFAIVGSEFGLGGMKDLELTVILGSILILTISSMTVFFSMLVRHILGGPLLVFLFGIIPSFAYMLISEVTEKLETVRNILGFFPQNLFTELAQTEYPTKYVVKVICCAVVCFAVLYTLTYISYKKKNFK